MTHETTDTIAEIERIVGEFRRNFAEQTAADEAMHDGHCERGSAEYERHSAAYNRHSEKGSALELQLFAIAPTTARGLLMQLDALEAEWHKKEEARRAAVEGTGGINDTVFLAHCRRFIEGLAESQGSADGAAGCKPRSPWPARSAPVTSPAPTVAAIATTHPRYWITDSAPWYRVLRSRRETQ